jgi:TPR repeat protein
MQALAVTLSIIFGLILFGLLAQVPWPIWATIGIFILIKSIFSESPKNKNTNNEFIEADYDTNIRSSQVSYSQNLDQERELQESNFQLINKYSKSDIKGRRLLKILIEYINSPVQNRKLENADRFENLYLAIRFREDNERSKIRLRWAIFDYYQVGSDHRDSYDEVINGIFSRLMDGCDDKDADMILKDNISPFFSNKPARFPTDFIIANVAAVPEYSFLEEGLWNPEKQDWELDKAVVNRTFSISELREESKRLIKVVGKDRFEKYLRNSINLQRAYAQKSLGKLLEKQGIKASDLKNGLKWAASLCYAADADSVAHAEETVLKLIGMVGTGKRTQAMEAALSNLEAFLAYPKGVGTQGQAERQEQILAELRQAAGFVASGPPPKGQEFFSETLELAKRVLLLPNAVCQQEQLDALAEVLKFARLNVATLEDDTYVSETSEKLVSQLKIVNERRKEAIK